MICQSHGLAGVAIAYSHHPIQQSATDFCFAPAYLAGDQYVTWRVHHRVEHRFMIKAP